MPDVTCPDHGLVSFVPQGLPSSRRHCLNVVLSCGTQALFRRLRGAHADPAEPGMSVFGLEVALLKVSVDGTSLDVADTAANRAAFGAPPRNGKGTMGPFPEPVS